MATLTTTVELLRGHAAVGQQESGPVIPLDRPVQTGGTGLGFNGGHLMLLGWGACFKSTLIAAADARDIAITSLRLTIRGETADAPQRFETLRMEVDLDAETTEAEKKKLVQIARNGCIVSNTLARGAELHAELR